MILFLCSFIKVLLFLIKLRDLEYHLMSSSKLFGGLNFLIPETVCLYVNL